MEFESLDFLYFPIPNIQESIRYYTKVLDGELLWKLIHMVFGLPLYKAIKD
jgi:hypothetical protein